jgi:hypothetical protein
MSMSIFYARYSLLLLTVWAAFGDWGLGSIRRASLDMIYPHLLIAVCFLFLVLTR